VPSSRCNERAITISSRSACKTRNACRSTTWGITDAHTWLDDTNQWSWAGQGPHYPLLFNADGSKKSAYDGTARSTPRTMSRCLAATGCLTPPGRRARSGPRGIESGPGAPASIPYRWKSVVILGGGSWTGIVFSPVRAGIGYARTDIAVPTVSIQPTGVGAAPGRTASTPGYPMPVDATTGAHDVYLRFAGARPAAPQLGPFPSNGGERLPAREIELNAEAAGTGGDSGRDGVTHDVRQGDLLPTHLLAEVPEPRIDVAWTLPRMRSAKRKARFSKYTCLGSRR